MEIEREIKQQWIDVKKGLISMDEDAMYYTDCDNRCDFIMWLLKDRQVGDKAEFILTRKFEERDNRVILQILFDFMSNLKKNSGSQKLFGTIYWYAKQFQHERILKLLERRIPAQKLPDEIISVIFEHLCCFSTNFPVMFTVNKMVNEVCEKNIGISQKCYKKSLILERVIELKEKNSCDECRQVGLLVKSEYNSIRRTCAGGCDHYCENRNCEYFGRVVNKKHLGWGNTCDCCGNAMALKMWTKVPPCVQSYRSRGDASCLWRDGCGYASAKLYACKKCIKTARSDFYGGWESDYSDDL